MASTNKDETLILVTKKDRDLLKELAAKEGRHMKRMIGIIIEDYFKRNGK